MTTNRVRLLALTLCGATAVACPASADDKARPTASTPTQGDGEASDSIEHTFVVGIGAAGELELADGSFHPGASVMVEWDAIEDWLELELGASILSAEGGVELPIDLLFKKPFRVSRRAELFVGVGPEILYVSSPTTKQTYVGGQLALDFFYWPWQRVGFWIEPEYDFVVRDGVAHGLGSTGGVVLGW